MPSFSHKCGQATKIFHCHTGSCIYHESPCRCVCLTACETWKRHDGVVSAGGTWYSLISLTNCQTRCLTMSTCVAVDVSSSICVVHTNANDIDTTFPAVDFTQYILNIACHSTTPSSVSPGKLYTIHDQHTTVFDVVYTYAVSQKTSRHF